jgi:endonuclease-3
MTKKEKRERLALIIERLKDVYPEAECALEYEGDPWRLLVMARLSAQCTDARVNIVSRELFRVFPTARDMMDGDLSEIEKIVKPCGLYRMKAKNIKDSMLRLINEYDGVIPDSMDELLEFEGVGRKIANLLIGDIFGGPAIVCDTHCIRICGRFGMYPEKEKNPEKIERILRDLMNPRDGADFCHRIVFFGREVCTARSPRCDECRLNSLCEHGKKAICGTPCDKNVRKNDG